MGEFTQSLLKKLHITNPYEGFDYQQFPLDLSGGGFLPGFILPLMEITRPRLIIEVGTWKGTSAIQMASIIRELGIDGAVICIDTWLGGLEHILNTDPVWGLSRHYHHGYPTIYYQFLANVIQRVLQDYIIPFPNTSNIAARWLLKNNIEADLIFIDGSHDEEDVKQDLANYWKVMKPGGVIFGDDYHSDWSGVVNAVDWFAACAIASKYTSGRTPIAMPTYNRPHYIRQFFKALRECDNLDLFMLVTCEEPDFPEVTQVIETVDFMPVERHIHHTRWGCSRNGCSAINYAFQHSQVAIILEDDIVPAKDFLNYMLWGLDTFQGDPRVIAIGGYQMLKILPDSTLVNVAQKITWLTPWGWATWRDRWDRFYQTGLYLAHNPTWDVYFDDFMFAVDGIEIVLAIGRTQNIGEQGVNVPSAEWQRENQQTPYWHGNGDYSTLQPDEFKLRD